MKTINTYDELYTATTGHQVTAQEVINGRTMIAGEGWQAVAFTPDFKDQFCKDISESLGGFKVTQQRIYSVLKYSRPQHWGLQRFLLAKYDESPAYFSYCAGQDMPYELKMIRAALK